uniref:Uncharacterized protein n=1 Tax=Rhizophora mucronata TaxID=61149 RepID=A0A2P2N527_RHIMU
MSCVLLLLHLAVRSFTIMTVEHFGIPVFETNAYGKQEMQLTFL